MRSDPLTQAEEKEFPSCGDSRDVPPPPYPRGWWWIVLVSGALVIAVTVICLIAARSTTGQASSRDLRKRTAQNTLRYWTALNNMGAVHGLDDSHDRMDEALRALEERLASQSAGELAIQLLPRVRDVQRGEARVRKAIHELPTQDVDPELVAWAQEYVENLKKHEEACEELCITMRSAQTVPCEGLQGRVGLMAVGAAMVKYAKASKAFARFVKTSLLPLRQRLMERHGIVLP